MIKAALSWAAEKGPIQTSLDVGSIGTAVAAYAGWLPEVAAMFTIIWTAIRIYETATVQKFITRLLRKETE